MAMAMATTKSKSLTIHSGKPGSTLSTLRPETTLKKAFTAGHCCRAGREDTQQGTSTDWIEYQFSDFHVFHVFSWRFSVFTFFFFLFFFSNFLSSSLAPPSAMATHKLLSYISSLISRFSSPRRTQRLAAPFEFEWKWFYLIFIFLLCSQAFARVHVHVLSSRVAVVPVILVFVAFLIETLNVLHSQQQLGKCICRSLIVLRFHRADMRLSNKISIFFGSFFSFFFTVC